MEGIMGILKPSGGDAGGDAGGGVDMAAVMGLIGSLTNRWFGLSDSWVSCGNNFNTLCHRGGGGGGAADGFLQLLGGAAGGGGGGGEGGASSTSNIVKILLGLAKSYFNVKSGSSPAIQV